MNITEQAKECAEKLKEELMNEFAISVERLLLAALKYQKEELEKYAAKLKEKGECERER